ncbi:MAG: hypothetical protein LBI87_00870 [Candidatus Accumulibacter sp.]|nr:hypothetical protein [Accumulibacter sp.]
MNVSDARKIFADVFDQQGNQLEHPWLVFLPACRKVDVIGFSVQMYGDIETLAALRDKEFLDCAGLGGQFEIGFIDRVIGAPGGHIAGQFAILMVIVGEL